MLYLGRQAAQGNKYKVSVLHENYNGMVLESLAYYGVKAHCASGIE